MDVTKLTQSYTKTKEDAYKDDDSFAETENEIMLHNVYRFLQSHRISEYYQEQCNVCGKGCKAE